MTVVAGVVVDFVTSTVTFFNPLNPLPKLPCANFDFCVAETKGVYVSGCVACTPVALLPVNKIVHEEGMLAFASDRTTHAYDRLCRSNDVTFDPG